MTTIRAVDAFARRHRYKPLEALPWVAAIAAYFAFPSYLALGAQILATWRLHRRNPCRAWLG
jgi:branched-chain amino acid transport system permease protein